MNYVTWAGLNIESNMPKDLLQKAMDYLQENHYHELVQWHKEEFKKQSKELNK